MDGNQRKSGLTVIPIIPWSTHFCQFYETKADLVENAVSFLNSGIYNNECCVWIISDIFSYNETVELLRSSIPEIDIYLANEQLIIKKYSDWYLKNGKLEKDNILNLWQHQYYSMINRGYEGLRIVADAHWLNDKYWHDFIEYESIVHDLISQYKIIALCAYSQDSCNATQLIDIVNRHEFALIKTGKKWELLENSVYKQTKTELSFSEEKFKSVFENSPIGIQLFDENGCLLIANNSSMEILGIENVSEITGKQLFDDPNLTDNVKESIKNGDSVGFELAYDFEKAKKHKYLFSKYTGIKYLDYLVTPMRNYNNPDISSYLVQLQDVTERKTTDESLNSERNILQVIMENTGSHLAYLDPKFNYIKVNSNFAKGCLSSPEKLVGKNHFDIFNDLEAQKIFDQVVRTGKGVSFNDKPLNFRGRSDNTPTYWDWMLNPVKNSDGKIQGLVLSLNETTERKNLEEKLARINDQLEARVKERTLRLEMANKALDEEIYRHTEARRNMAIIASNYYNLISNNLDGIIIFSEQKNIIFANAAAERLLDCKAEDMDGQKLGYLTGYPDQTEIEIIQNNGKKIYAETRIVKIDWENQACNMVSLRDITQRKITEQALHKSSSELETLFNTMTEGVTLIDKNGIVLKTNSAMSTILGISISEIEGQQFSKQGLRFIDYNQKTINRNELPVSQVIRNKKIVNNVELGIERFDKKIVWVNVNAVPILDEFGNIEGVVRTYADITERKRMEDAYQQSEVKLRLMLSQLPCMLWSTDNNLNVTLSLGAVSQINIAESRQGNNPDLHEYFKTGGRDLPVINAHKLALKGAASSYEFNMNNRIFSAYVEPLIDSTNKIVGTLGIGFDITEKKHAEEALRALSTRLVDVQENERRELARELHDEIGQSLTALKFMITQATRQYVNEVPEALTEGQELVTNLIKQVRELSLTLRPSMLDDLGLLPTLLWYIERYTAQTNIEVIFKHFGLNRLFPSEINTSIYRIVQEALTNVARHSMANKVNINMQADDLKILIFIEDNGRGFNASAISSRNSTGISGMRERVFMLNGLLNIETSVGQGTNIHVELPLKHFKEHDKIDSRA